MTQLSGVAFITKWSDRFADNISREISEEDLRDFTEDVKDSFYNIADFVAPAASYASLSGLPTDNVNTVAWGNGIINTVRGGVAIEYNTIKKLYDFTVAQLLLKRDKTTGINGGTP